MTIEEVKLTDIKPYENNPRKNDGAVDSVAESIKQFGFKQPIVIDKDGVIVAGHTRYKAAKKLKLKTVPCVRADDLTEEQVKAYRILDNKVGEVAAWDFDALEIELADFDFDFTPFEVELSDFTSFDGNDSGDSEDDDKKDDAQGEVSKLATKYEVNVELDSEEEQRALFEELNARGFKIRCVQI